MGNELNLDLTKSVITGVCDSCNAEAELFAVKHHQLNNPKVWLYCETCKFAHDREMLVQEQLKNAPLDKVNDLAFVTALHKKAVDQLIQVKVKEAIAAKTA